MAQLTMDSEKALKVVRGIMYRKRVAPREEIEAISRQCRSISR